MGTSRNNPNLGKSGKHLREFYKKLLATDAQINKLKKGLVASPNTFNNGKFKRVPERDKRSLYSAKQFTNLKQQIKDNITKIFKLDRNPKIKPKRRRRKGVGRHKRYGNDTNVEMPTGIMFEKKKLLVQYIPNDTPKFPKCSHTPTANSQKFHENQMKHPFYKNTQRLDELLDQFLDKRLPDIMVDPFNNPQAKVKQLKHTIPRNPMHNLYESSTQIYNKYVTPNVNKAKKIKTEIMKILQSDDESVSSTTEAKRDYNFRHYTSDYEDKTRYASNTDYDLVLSISTIMNPSEKKATRLSSSEFLGKFPSRKLLQTEEEDEDSLGYEDEKEVLSEEMDTHDETDKRMDRKRRDGPPQGEHNFEEVKIPNPIRYSPPGVYNPNWKGPMPLYPDEINSAIKSTVVQNPIKNDLPEIPVNSKDTAAELDKSENDMNAVEYIEDYLDNKYDKLVKMAQAYSDYGVLESKKDNSNEKDLAMNDKVDHRVKMSAKKSKSMRNKFFERFKKGGTTEAEGMKIEFRNNGYRSGPNFLSKYIKIEPDDRIHPQQSHFTTMLPMNPNFDLIGEPTTEYLHKSNKPIHKSQKKKEKYSENNLYQNRLKRSLKSINLDAEISDTYDNYSNDIVEIVTESNVTKYKCLNENKTLNDSEKQDLPFILLVKRSVKAIDMDNNTVQVNLENISELYKTNQYDDRNESRAVNDANSFENDYHYKDNFSVTDALRVNKISKEIESVDKKLNENKTKSDPADFLMMLSSWFGTLAGLAFDGNRTGNNPNLDIINLFSSFANVNETTRRNITYYENTTEITVNDENTTKNITKIDIMYPLYDSVMIDNIGHRSRVLMSFKEEHVNVSKSKNDEIENVTEVDNHDKIVTNLTSTHHANTTYKTEVKDKETVTTTDVNKKFDDSIIENKTLIKRSASEDSNLIFWNDIYDDEYGIQIDPIDNTMRERHSPISNDLMKKSGVWFQDKVKKLTDTVKRKSKDGLNKLYSYNTKKKPSRDASHGIESLKGIINIDHKINKRDDEGDDDADSWPDRDTFNVLTAHMKEVCKEAVQALHKTRNVEVREDNQKSDVSTGLMRQLVKLMTDLVDYQVQLKTCLKLPPDLQEFLTWLTAPVPHHDTPKPFQVSHGDDILGKLDKQRIGTKPAQTTKQTTEYELNQSDARTECLGTLRAVEQLIWEYDHMSEEDKSKMTGIREYLENQLNFLSRQLDSYDENNMQHSMNYNNEIPNRYRRDLHKAGRDSKPDHKHLYKRHNESRKMKTKLGKFIKNFGKKHTRTTANNYDLVQLPTEVITKEKVVDSNANLKFQEGIEAIYCTDKLKRSVKGSEKVKRNLKGIYYHALAEAKKYTTVKHLHKKELERFDRPRVVRIQN